MNPRTISSNTNSCENIDVHRFLFHVTTSVAYLWLKSKIYPDKLPVMTNNALAQVVRFSSIYAF